MQRTMGPHSKGHPHAEGTFIGTLVNSRCRRREVEFKGGCLHDGFGGSGKHLALLLLVLQNTVPRGSRDGVDGFGGYGGFGRDSYHP